MSTSAPPPANPGSTASPPPAASTKPPPGEAVASSSPPPPSSLQPPAPLALTPPPASKAPPPAAQPPPSPPSPTPPSDSEPSPPPPPPIPTSSTPPLSPPAQPAIAAPPPPLANRTPPPPPQPSPPAVLPLPPPASPSGANASPPPPPAIAVPTPPAVPIDTPTPPSSIPAPRPPAAPVVTPPSSSNLAPIKPSSQSSPQESSRHSSGTSVAVGVGAAAAVAFVVFVCLFWQKKRRSGEFWKGYKDPLNGFSTKNRKTAAPKTVEKTYRIYVGDVLDPSVKSKQFFTYEELTSITNGFSPDSIIGEGGFGAVYRGVLLDGRQVAVKQLKPGSGQGVREFRAEVEIISRIHHRHLVSLVGYCTERHRLLVYEFVANNSLDHHLHGKGLPVLDWPKRIRIAIGSARGLAYLHDDCNPRIIHRDIKSANILLDESFEAKVADFGLAKLTNDTSTHISTRVMGTFGYLAPEYAFSGKLTDRSDVYSFGVVLLELVTGRKPVDPSLPSGDGSLVEWARPLLVHALETGQCEHLVDPRLQNNYEKMDMLRAIEVATACVRHSAPKRPRMVQVLRTLDSGGCMPDLSNGVKFGESTVYNSSQYSADIEQLRRMAFERDKFTIDYASSGAERRGTEVAPGLTAPAVNNRVAN